MRKTRLCAYFFALTAVTAASVQAQATRTWVSGVGDDANPCSRTAPCKTFAGAISKTAAGGEIDALDPGGFGAVTITKAVTIDGGQGQVGSVLVSGTNGIVIVAGAADVVTLRNLSIDGIGSGINGVSVQSAGNVHIEHCTIFGFTGNGIDIETPAGAHVTVSDTVSRDNGGSGLYATSTGSTVSVSISGSRFDNNAIGLFAVQGSQISVSGSEVSGNEYIGFCADSSGAVLNISNSLAANNLVGIQSLGATIRLNGVSVSGNGTGLSAVSEGSIISFGNNFISDSGTPTSTIGPK